MPLTKMAKVETLEQALTPNVSSIVRLVVQAQDNKIGSGVSILLALSERWHASFSWYDHDASLIGSPSAHLRGEVYRTLQETLLSGEGSTDVVRHLLNEMKRLFLAQYLCVLFLITD
jgi:hypothetical protein